MKKAIPLLLALVLCLSLTACGKSEAVKNVEAMIDALGEITLESIDTIRSAEDAYNALTADEQKKVDNYETLTEARDSYYELALVGEWVRNHISIYDIESNYETVSIILNSDMTGTQCDDGHNPLTWSVLNSQLCLDMGHYQNTYSIIEEDGILYFHYYEKEMPQENVTWQSDSVYLSVSDFHTYLDDIFLTVELTPENVANYCELFISMPTTYIDEWGEEVELENTSASLRLKNAVYDDGWLYFSSSRDTAIEVLYPEYTLTHFYGEDSSFDTIPAGSTTLTESHPYISYFPMELDQSWGDNSSVISDLTVDDLSFGRAKGTITFINSEYVIEVICNRDEYSRSLITEFGEISTGFWNEAMGDF